ncbi:MAG TPA: HAD family hydrolase [Gemmatimonadaceae bacterium]|nr:HAD family hydrolase [Gemmatimonadaceae bacterium]
MTIPAQPSANGGGAAGAPRAAAFLDRDGTLIEDVHYIARADDVRLLAGAADAVRRLNQAGVSVVIVTNQSGIGRGIVTEAEYAAVRERFEALLAAEGAHVDATYHCPHAPGTACECRKPGTALYARAIAEHNLDGARSYFIGDRIRDIEPSRAFGGRGVLVPSLDTPTADYLRARDEFVIATTLGAAVDRMLAGGGSGVGGGGASGGSRASGSSLQPPAATPHPPPAS